MLLVHRVYGLNPLARATIAVGCVVLGAALITTGALGVFAIVPIVLAFAIVNRLVPGGRMTMVPMSEEAQTDRNAQPRRLPFTIAAAVLVGLAVFFLVTDRPLVVGGLVVAAICVPLIADALGAV